MKKILFFILILGVMILSSCTDDKSQYDPFNFDDVITVDYYTDQTNTFRYVKEQRFDDEKKEYYDVCRLFGLTNSGSKLEYLYFPNQIDGMDVIGFGCNISSDANEKKFVSQFRSTKLKRLFFDINFTCDANFFAESYNLVSLPNCYVVWISVDGPTGNFINTLGNIITWDMYKNKTYSPDLMNNKLLVGNITYQYGYDDAPNNNVYCIDSYDNIEREYIVNYPNRDDYICNEWYYLDDNSLECWFSSGKKCSDEICVNKKNYETYLGLVVYPKWVKLYTQPD